MDADSDVAVLAGPWRWPPRGVRAPGNRRSRDLERDPTVAAHFAQCDGAERPCRCADGYRDSADSVSRTDGAPHGLQCRIRLTARGRGADPVDPAPAARAARLPELAIHTDRHGH